ncbi:uncharacterized protein CTRU02_214367 [Colletotrichum truncatum]|uniref:Uncharacterized protein n=1 Tax=Colletotrichum truncatum TaxID=5467 RepID=A0ACC3YEK6_COLTU|nr:uncharacterized protein CTRU02_13529 [Colletotrichum truncatum]XP_036584636.1 uncharacterized protein CTRU02_05711 [Colletotrichum truncatum]KAF6783293.1 hypothetical protein CTRU02_13529 [Colletotrichum truncatum]KAF6794154.1 hypothetical protein CTRU02_05711 [Colletotrichum truncatum]
MSFEQDEESTREKWAAVTSWEALVDLNVEFIKSSAEGRRDVSTPYHHGPLDEETEELIPSLLHLHEYGLLTTQSQPILASEPEYIAEQQKWYEWRQIPCVDFFFEYQSVEAHLFLSYLINDNRLKVVWTEYRHGSISRTSHTQSIPLSFKRVSARRESLQSEQWRVTAGLPKTVLSLDDCGFESVPAACQGIIMGCIVIANHKQGLYKKNKQETFLRKLANIDVFTIVAKHAEAAGLRCSKNGGNKEKRAL